MNCILLHGLGQSPTSWDGTVKALGGEVRCETPDLAGWLRGREADYTALLEALEAYCGQTSEPLNLAGLSLGGILALDYACRHPERVRSLVLMGTQFVMPRGLLKIQDLIFRLMPKKAFLETGFQKRDFIRLTGSMIALDFQNELGNISCPVLVVCGGKDRANRPASQELAERIGGAKLSILENAGHEVNTEAPEALGALMREFYIRLGQ